MSDYISREAVIDELDEWKELYRDSGAACDVLVLAKRAIQKIPAADVRPVVTCGECECFVRSKNVDRHMTCSLLPDIYVRKPEDFCSRGIRSQPPRKEGE